MFSCSLQTVLTIMLILSSRLELRGIPGFFFKIWLNPSVVTKTVQSHLIFHPPPNLLVQLRYTVHKNGTHEWMNGGPWLLPNINRKALFVSFEVIQKTARWTCFISVSQPCWNVWLFLLIILSLTLAIQNQLLTAHTVFLPFKTCVALATPPSSNGLRYCVCYCVIKSITVTLSTHVTKVLLHQHMLALSNLIEHPHHPRWWEQHREILFEEVLRLDSLKSMESLPRDWEAVHQSRASEAARR